MTSEWQSWDYAPVSSTWISALLLPQQNFHAKESQIVGEVEGVGGGGKKEGEGPAADPAFLLQETDLFQIMSIVVSNQLKLLMTFSLDAEPGALWGTDLSDGGSCSFQNCTFNYRNTATVAVQTP